LKFILLALVLLPGAPALSGREADQKGKVAELMRRKLQRAQKVLEGVALRDFEMIAQNAEELVEISKEAQWKVLRTPRYEIYSGDFRRNAEALIANAKDKNLDAAALSYVDLTLTCVKCHKHVREVRMVRR
jgi:hypothetical protein